MRAAIYDSYGSAATAKRLYSELTPAQRAIEGVDFSAAMAACPQRINIAARLRDAQRLLA